MVVLLLTTAMFVFQTVSPVRTTREMIFSYKHSMLLGKAQTMAASLNTGPVLTHETAQDVAGLLGTGDVDQLVITDDEGMVLYSSNTGTAPLETCVLFPEVVSALTGNDAFRCVCTSDAFRSYGATPIMAGNLIIGCVYVAEEDREQAALVGRIRQNAFRTTLIALGLSLLLFLAVGAIVVRQNQRILRSIRMVREGDYNHRIEIRGRNEYAALAREFNALTDRLQQTEARRQQFVSDASHELRTPLAAIRLLSDSILQNQPDPETTREFVQDISGESERLARMTTKLLSLTALDSRQIGAEENQPVDLGACCRKAVRMLTPFAREHGAELEESSQNNCCVLAREDDIFQVVLNLAENGIKYSQTGGIVRLIAYAQGDQAILIVEDNGIGIPEEELERIFERFYRVDKARSREAGGTGLGLAIVRETVERFGGTVIASNRPQGGARFTVEFPRLVWEGEP